jgi:hypothetical protein
MQKLFSLQTLLTSPEPLFYLIVSLTVKKRLLNAR